MPMMQDSWSADTFATRYLQRPLDWGADIVVHSTTKVSRGGPFPTR